MPPIRRVSRKLSIERKESRFYVLTALALIVIHIDKHKGTRKSLSLAAQYQYPF